MPQEADILLEFVSTIKPNAKCKLYYRSMAEQDGKPKTGRSASLLGVRLDADINVEEMPIGCLCKQGYLLPKSQRKFQGKLMKVAIRDAKGMSVSLSIEGLPVCVQLYPIFISFILKYANYSW